MHSTTDHSVGSGRMRSWSPALADELAESSDRRRLDGRRIVGTEEIEELAPVRLGALDRVDRSVGHGCDGAPHDAGPIDPAIRDSDGASPCDTDPQPSRSRLGAEAAVPRALRSAP